VALTFDDGPDGRWTPKILDILKREHAPATFFVIGQNMQHRPDLVRRELREGHDVGGHTFTHPNIGQVPHAEVALELNATQRLFETLTGRSMRLFRPPFFGDADPSTPNEVAPLLTAQELGYVNVGLRIDPDDWKKPQADTIVNNVLDRLQSPGNRPGQVILLHDSGGDRAQTVKALPGLIHALRARGYTLVTVSHLAGITQAQAMPAADRSSWSLAVDRAAFFLVTNFETAVRALLVTAIALGLLRLAFLATMALTHRFRTEGETPPELDPTTGPLISVLIPCFNEEKVIVESVRRILASHWTELEVLVLDDGSKDRTAEVVEQAWGGHPRVRLMRFENGGKARALNRGLVEAKGEIVVALDADTLFAPETLGRLARWFEDPKIGAVAGNALVGNRVNLVTRWQALEYVTAQNLERRALAALGAVTVVPGAVGAWRRTALEELGGYPGDTLAEDQDLTLAVQRAGWKVTFDPEARAYTESPDTVGGLLKQRFRWSFGTLQCLWKHRAALFSRKIPVLGWVALPQVWLFQIVLTVIAPLVDLAVVWSLVSAWMAAQSHPLEYDPDGLIRGVAYWLAFVLLDLAAGVLGLSMERRAPWADLPWLPLQRFGYRQMMYYVVVKAVSTAVQGRRVGWGKLERKATVAAPEAGSARAA
jgi:peptidoglycan/xylan/chitin deacetylase (PgdA/CDA1 family)/GT2 family glycosyltransferase